MSADFVLILGDRPLSEPDRLQNEFERPLARPDPYRRNPEQADLPTVVRKLDLARSRTPTAFRGAPGYAGSGKADPDGLYLKHLAEAARAGRDAVARDGGQVRLAWHSRLPSR